MCSRARPSASAPRRRAAEGGSSIAGPALRPVRNARAGIDNRLRMDHLCYMKQSKGHRSIMLRLALATIGFVLAVSNHGTPAAAADCTGNQLPLAGRCIDYPPPAPAVVDKDGNLCRNDQHLTRAGYCTTTPNEPALSDASFDQPMVFAMAASGGNIDGSEWIAAVGEITDDTP